MIGRNRVKLFSFSKVLIRHSRRYYFFWIIIFMEDFIHRWLILFFPIFRHRVYILALFYFFSWRLLCFRFVYIFFIGCFINCITIHRMLVPNHSLELWSFENISWVILLPIFKIITVCCILHHRLIWQKFVWFFNFRL